MLICLDDLNTPAHWGFHGITEIWNLMIYRLHRQHDSPVKSTDICGPNTFSISTDTLAVIYVEGRFSSLRQRVDLEKIEIYRLHLKHDSHVKSWIQHIRDFIWHMYARVFSFSSQCSLEHFDQTWKSVPKVPNLWCISPHHSLSFLFTCKYYPKCVHIGPK